MFSKLWKTAVRACVGVVGLFASAAAFAIDTTAMVTAIGTAATDVTAVAVAIFAVTALMFTIAKIRQLGKA